MEVVPTGEGEEDGVIWLRCPRCQGFLPKISSPLTELAETEAAPPEAAGEECEPVAPVIDAAVPVAEAPPAAAESPAVTDEAPRAKEATGNSVAEYAALLAEVDVSAAVPYRPWDSYAVGDVIHHLAWDDCGVVVAKETLPGNRKVVKVFFAEAGIVRLIEDQPRQP